VTEIGQQAPEFALESDSGETITLESLRGRPVVVYFYPNSSTIQGGVPIVYFANPRAKVLRWSAI
jgi:peroxiredoxin